MGPLLATLERTLDVVIGRQVLPRPPLANGRPVGVDLANGVAPHPVRVALRDVSALDPGGDIGRDLLPTSDQRVAVRQPLIVVMHVDVAMLPDHVAVVVDLHEGAGAAADVLESLRRLRWETLDQEVAVRKPLEVLDALGVMPLVNGPSLGVEQIGVTAAHRAVDRVAAERLRLVAVHEAERPVPNPGHVPTPAMLVTLRRALEA